MLFSDIQRDIIQMLLSDIQRDITGLFFSWSTDFLCKNW
jgi:hypothetical protein